MYELYIATIACWNCDTPMKVGAVKGAIEPGPADDEEIYDFIEYNQDPELAKKIQAHLPNYRLAEHAHTFGEPYYASHCNACDQFAGDHFLLRGTDSPFLYEEHEKVIQL